MSLILSLEPAPIAGVDRQGDLLSAAFSPDGRALVTGGADGAVQLWDADGDRLFRTLQPGGDDVRVLSVAAGGTGRQAVVAAGTGDGRVLTWRLVDGSPLAVVACDQLSVWSLTADRAGTLLAVGDGQRVRLHDPVTGRPVRRLDGHQDRVTDVAFDPHGGRLATADMHAVRLWATRTGRLLRTFPGHPGSRTTVAFDPSGGRLAGTGSTAHAVHIWDTRTGRETAAIDFAGSTPQSMAFSPDGRLLALGGGDCSLRLVDASTGVEAAWFAGRRMIAVRRVFYTPDGGGLVAVPSRGGALRRWRIRPAQAEPGASIPVSDGETRSLRHSRAVCGVAFSPDGALLARGAVNGTADVHLWRLGEAPRLQRLHGHTAPVTTVAFDPSGESLATAGEDRTVLLWDTATGDEIAELTEHRRAIRAIAFSADGRWLASADEAGDVLLRDAANGTPLLRLAPHNGMVLSLAFHPRSDALATAGADGEVRIHTRWSAAPT